MNNHQKIQKEPLPAASQANYNPHDDSFDMMAEPDGPELDSRGQHDRLGAVNIFSAYTTDKEDFRSNYPEQARESIY